MSNKKWCVYVHIFPNGKKYFGITSKSPKKRWQNGSGYKKEGNTSIIYNAILKFGWDNIKHIILYDGLSKEEACILEKKLIAENKINVRRYGNRYGYNMTDGGEGTLGHKVPESLKRKSAQMFHELRGVNHYRAKPLICDDKEWECMFDFCREYGYNWSAVKKWLEGINDMPIYWYNKHLRYKDESLNIFEIHAQKKPFKYYIEYDGEIFNSQREFADYIGVAPSALCRWIKNNKIPKELLDKGFKRFQKQI